MAETTAARRERERELVLATRALFDERGMQHAPIEEIARTVGIARGLVYRVFSSKEELFVLTVTDYLDELGGRLEEALAAAGEPVEALDDVTCAYAQFCLQYPAFLDCALSLMQRPARDLHALVSESVWLRLGDGMARCIGVLAAVLRDGTDRGAWAVADADLTANVLWTQGLGVMHLSRIGVGLRQDAEGAPQLFGVADEQVVRVCVESARAVVGAGTASPPTVS